MDLLAPNIIYNEKDNSTRFIDMEYACVGNRGFDIGNHFNEWCGYNLDETKYPTEQQERQFLHAYFKSYFSRDPTEDELKKLVNECNAYSLISHIFWGCWALVQANVSTIDFDYITYGLKRFDMFTKSAFNYLLC